MRDSPFNYQVFLSHGKEDAWVAAQIAARIHETGATAFLDETDIAKGADFKKRIHEEIRISRELVALFTPWSSKRSWVWIEIGAAWGRELPVVGLFYGMKTSDLEDSGQGKAIFEDFNILNLNHFETYISQLRIRVQSKKR
jgi:hypothetical protein